MAEILNSYFASVFVEESREDIPRKERETDALLSGIPVTEKLVKERIDKIKYHSTAGPDGITSMFLKETKVQVAVPLAIIYRKSLQEGRVPSDWKKANVTPIFKKGTKGEAKNYRPVLLTSIP